MRAKPGELLKSPRANASTLMSSPPLRRLEDNLRDLITIAYERCTNRRSNSLILARLEYVISEKQDEKCFMRFGVLVKEAEQNENVPLILTIIAETEEDASCSQL